jgi:hypothetical protein
VEKALLGVPGVHSAAVALTQGEAEVHFDPARTTPVSRASCCSFEGFAGVTQLHHGVKISGASEEKVYNIPCSSFLSYLWSCDVFKTVTV